MRLFGHATDEEIKKGETTDVYFDRTIKVLKAKGLEKTAVAMEVTSGSLPRGWPWGILCGIEEEAKLFEGYSVNVYVMPEGSIFYPTDHCGFREPVMLIEGQYGDFGMLETALLGLMCQSSGIATAAARIKKIAGDKLVASFGIRRMHPALSLAIDRAAYIGGFDGVSGVAGARNMGIEPMGTMPHALIVIFGDQARAWKAFDEALPESIPRVALVDTYYDEKVESVMAAEALKERLRSVRLDTPGSRKGDFAAIIREVRWELDLRGHKDVKIFVSGGLDEESVRALSEAGADGFGVGTSVSNAPTIDFAADIVEVNGRFAAKRGKLSGRKQVWRCRRCLVDSVKPMTAEPAACPQCGGGTEPMLKPFVKKGKIVAELPSATEIRKYVLSQLSREPVTL